MIRPDSTRMRTRAVPMSLVALNRKIRKAAAIIASGRLPWWRALAHGVAPSLEHAQPLRALRPQTVLDIGAHRGQFMLLARALWPEAQIHSFEPQQEPRRTLRTLGATDKRWHLHAYALGDQRRSTKIHVAGRDDSSSLLPSTPRQHAAFPGTETTGSETVQEIPLDELLPGPKLIAPVLMKIDVQGYELAVLRGAQKLLPAVRWVYIECSDAELYQGQATTTEVLGWLEEEGFVLQQSFNTVSAEDGSRLQADFLLERSPPAASAQPGGHSA